MKLSICVVIALASSLAFGEEYQYAIFIKGEEIGSATYSVTVLKDGGLKQGLKMKMKVNGADSSFVAAQRYDSRGRPISETREDSSLTGSRSVKMTYTRAGLLVKIGVNGQISSKTYKYPRGSISTPSIYWFLKGTPARGATEQRYFFDFDKSGFFMRTTKYVGRTDILAGGKKVSAHHVKQGYSNMFLDPNGMPWEMSISDGSSTLTLVRKTSLHPGVKR